MEYKCLEMDFECYEIACSYVEIFWLNCIILEYECTVKDNVDGDEDGDGFHPGHLNLFWVIPF